MALIIHFKDGTTQTNSNWQQCAPIDANYFTVNGGGTPGTPDAFVPTANVLYVDLNG
jgi:hypothetical protein